jgi:hypothetical protein
MKTTALVLLCLALCAPRAAADLLLSSKSHTDAYELFGKAVPAKDSTTTLWLGKDRLRIESEGQNAIVRLDQKKLILLDPKEKVWRAIELPFDFKRYLPPEKVLLAEQMFGARALTAKLEERDETRKIGEWNAKRWDVTLSQQGYAITQEVVWASSELKADAAAFAEMYTALMSITPENRNLVKELPRLKGIPVRRERTQNVSGVAVKTVEELGSAVEKEAPAGLYDPPADFTEKPFDLLAKPAAAKAPPPAGGKPGG